MRPRSGKATSTIKLAISFLCVLQLGTVMAGANEPISPVSLDSAPVDRRQGDIGQPGKSGPTSQPLVGRIEAFQPHSLIGRWKGHVKRFHTHPKLMIDRCQDGQIAGTYKGIVGTFPVSGSYDENTGNITIHIDFSGSIWAKFRRFKSGHGLIEANIKDGVLVGQACIPEMGPKTLRWEAVKESDEKAAKLTDSDRDSQAE